jgi:hypothetical protein
MECLCFLSIAWCHPLRESDGEDGVTISTKQNETGAAKMLSDMGSHHRRHNQI